MKTIRMALTKGRLEEKTVEMLERLVSMTVPA